MRINTSQIDSGSLATFILSYVSGGTFSGTLGGYIAGGGYFGPNVVYTTGGVQTISGNLTFQNNPTVPYSGETGTAPSLRLVQDKIQYYIDSLSGTMTGNFVTVYGNQTIGDYKIFTGSVGVGPATIGIHAATLAQLSGASGILAAAIAANSILPASGALATGIAQTGAAAITYANSIGTNLSGSLTQTGIALRAFVTGVSGALQAQIAGAGSQVKVTGSSNIATANFTGIGGVTVSYDGTTISVSGGAGAGTVTQGQLDALSGVVGTSGSVLYNLLTGESGAFNTSLAATGAKITALSGFVGGVSGALQALIAGGGTQVQVTGSSTLPTANFTGIGGTYVYTVGSTVFVSGFSGAGGTTNNTYSITGSGIITVTGSAPILSGNLSGVGGTLVYTLGNQILISGGAGSSSAASTLVSLSFFNDPVPTGLNISEAFVANSFTFTGAAFACRTSGSAPANGGILSGKLYQVDSNNTEQNLFTFTFTTGIIYSGSPVFSVLVTGGNRVGLTITNVTSGIEKFTVGVFGS